MEKSYQFWLTVLIGLIILFWLLGGNNETLPESLAYVCPQPPANATPNQVLRYNQCLYQHTLNNTSPKYYDQQGYMPAGTVGSLPISVGALSGSPVVDRGGPRYQILDTTGSSLSYLMPQPTAPVIQSVGPALTTTTVATTPALPRVSYPSYTTAVATTPVATAVPTYSGYSVAY
jgi:hypothetical protein